MIGSFFFFNDQISSCEQRSAVFFYDTMCGKSSDFLLSFSPSQTLFFFLSSSGWRSADGGARQDVCGVSRTTHRHHSQDDGWKPRYSKQQGFFFFFFKLPFLLVLLVMKLGVSFVSVSHSCKLLHWLIVNSETMCVVMNILLFLQLSI